MVMRVCHWELEWTGKSMNGISSVTDCPRTGQAHRVLTPGANGAVEAIVKENRRITVNERVNEWRLSRKMMSLCTFCAQ